MSLTQEEQRELAIKVNARTVDEYGWDFDVLAFRQDELAAYTAAVEAKERDRIANIYACTFYYDNTEISIGDKIRKLNSSVI